MSTNEATQAWDNLMDFLASDEGMSDDEVIRDLKASGVDTDSFMKRIGDTVRRGTQSYRRQQAAAERSKSNAQTIDINQKVLLMPMATITQIINNAEIGKYGPLGQELAIACRNEQSKEPTESELRALVEDILLTTDTRLET